MNMKVEDLLALCLYYTLNKSAATLSHFVSPTANKGPHLNRIKTVPLYELKP